MKAKICHEIKDIMPQWTIRLVQKGPDNFTVFYGKQVDSQLTYAAAAEKYGQAIMHALACEGRLDNRTREEAGLRG